MSNIRIVFMGSPQFAIPALGALLRSEYKVIAVYTQPDRPGGRGQKVLPSPVKTKALEHDLPIFQPKSLRRAAEIATLKGLNPDATVVAAYGLILPQEVLDIPPYGCINIHPSLLPKYRGPSPIAYAILNGDTVTGVSIMLLDAGMDSGPILSQKEVAIEPKDTTGSLASKLAEVGASLLMEVLPLWLAGGLKPMPQDESKASYTKQFTKSEGEIDWRLPAKEIERRIRAFQPWPGCYTYWQGKVLKIIEAMPIAYEGVSELGKVISLPKSYVAEVGIQTGDGVLGLLLIQLEGRRAISAVDFVRGQRDFIGSIVTSPEAS